VPRELADLVERLLDKDVERRLQSASEVREAIDALLKSDLAAEPTTGVADKTLHSADANEGSKRRSPLVAGVVIAAILAALAFGVMKLRGGNAAAIDRGPAMHACRTWSDELVRRQRPDGAFTGEPKREPTGWDTGQELTALVHATDCAKVAPSSIRAATDALARLKQDDGWSGPHDPGKTVPATIAADAWVALSLALATRGDSSVADRAREARSFVVKAQYPDGSFGSGEPSPYVTMLAAWALVEGEDLDRSGAARHASLDRLRKYFRGAPADVRTAAGLEEQFVWVLLLARKRFADERSGDDVLRDAAGDLVARCALDHARVACTKPIYEEDRIKTRRSFERGDMLTFWLPWAGAAADALARSDVDLSADVRRDLRAIAQWVVHVFERSEDALAALPEYELAEYLVAASSLAAP